MSSHDHGSIAGQTPRASFSGSDAASHPSMDGAPSSSLGVVMEGNNSGVGSLGGAGGSSTVVGSGINSGVSTSTSGSDLRNLGNGLPSSFSSSAFSAGTGQGSSGFTAKGNGLAGLNEETVPQGFDEGVLRTLCDLDCGMPLVLDRLKQDLATCREVSAFFKKRAMIEEEYGRSLIKASRTSTETYSQSEGKAGTFVTSYSSLLRIHEFLGENRLRMAQQLNEMSDELANLAREVDKQRKVNKELGTRLERTLLEGEGTVDKARVRFDAAAEDLERLLLLKSGESLKDSENIPHSQTSRQSVGPPSALQNSNLRDSLNPTSKRTFGKAMSKIKAGVGGGGGLSSKSPGQIARMEEEARQRTSQASDAYRKEVLATQKIRQEWFNLQLPRILRSLKENMDEMDLGTQYHLTRYAYLFEKTLVDDGLVISPLGGIEDGPGLKAVAESVDNREDFKNYMQNYVVAFGLSGNKGPRREGPPEEGFLPNFAANHRTSASPATKTTPASTTPVKQARSSIAPASTPTLRPTFGVDLSEQMMRDNVEVPKMLEKCCATIEKYGLDSVGIYRLSGTTSRVQRLKGKLDRDIDNVNLESDENLKDINDISGVLKLWIRELPEPICTWELYTGFIEAAKIENERLRHIRIHERVNDLPDPNYASLKFLMGHLDKIRHHESRNQMGISNLAIVFGPNLLGAPPGEATTGSTLQDMPLQCRTVETILQHYREIFVDEAEE